MGEILYHPLYLCYTTPHSHDLKGYSPYYNILSPSLNWLVSLRKLFYNRALHNIQMRCLFAWLELTDIGLLKQTVQISLFSSLTKNSSGRQSAATSAKDNHANS